MECSLVVVETWEGNGTRLLVPMSGKSVVPD